MKTYKFDDVEEQSKILKIYHNVAEAEAQQLENETGIAQPEVWSLEGAIAKMKNRIARYYGSVSKYVPHQNIKECQRRLKRSCGCQHEQTVHKLIPKNR